MSMINARRAVRLTLWIGAQRQCELISVKYSQYYVTDTIRHYNLELG